MTGAALLQDEVLFEQCCALWLRAFAGPPWHASREGLVAQRAVAERQLTVGGAQTVLVIDAAGDVAGAAWGWPGHRCPDDELHRLVRAALNADLAERLSAPDVRVLVELMVDPCHQGHGIGGTLLDALIAERSSWLLSHPEGAGLPLYLRRGWREAGHLTRHGTPLLILVRDG